MIKLKYFHRHIICAVMQVDADQVLDVSERFIIFIMKLNTVTAGHSVSTDHPRQNGGFQSTTSELPL